MDLEALRDFMAVADHGSMAAAARARGTPKSTISKRIKTLEADLGLRLLDRTSRLVVLNPDGRSLLTRARTLVADADEIVTLMRDRDEVPRGLLRVVCPSLFAQVFAGRVAARCLAAWPGARIDMVVADRQIDLVAEGFDCAIQVGAVIDPRLNAFVLMRGRLVLVAAPALVARMGAPERPEDLAVRPWLSAGRNYEALDTRLRRGNEAIAIDTEPVLRLGNLTGLRDAALAGCGWCFLPEFLAREALDAGALVSALEAWTAPEVLLQLVTPASRPMPVRVRAFRDMLVTMIEEGIAAPPITAGI